MSGQDLSFECPNCGMVHEIALCFGSDEPEYSAAIPEAERHVRVLFDKGFCVVDNEHFFIRGRIEIPITDHSDHLLFNVWSSLSRSNFERAVELLEEPSRVDEPPYFGWLNSEAVGYSPSVNIKTWVHTNEPGVIPTFKIFEEGHALTRDQAEGIPLARAVEIASSILHAPEGRR